MVVEWTIGLNHGRINKESIKYQDVISSLESSDNKRVRSLQNSKCYRETRGLRCAIYRYAAAAPDGQYRRKRYIPQF
ncbi:hypothetical protein J6590_089019 [Homalodisca vitripennis]|nr:hypothetical protein J6590_089019 [Homalodisca vitripennis]